MRLGADQLANYDRDGFILVQDVFLEAEIDEIKSRLQNEFLIDSPARILEKDGTTVRSIYGSNRSDPYFDLLSRDTRLVLPAQQLLEGDVYVHQFKVNMKPAFTGDAWSWHQDFIFWVKEDGIQEPNLTTVALFLDEVNEFNGPLALFPGSHEIGLIDVDARVGGGGDQDQPWWADDLVADIKFQVPREMVAELARRNPPVAPKGRAGSLLIFHPNVVHGSATNISPFDRAVLLVTYNSVGNVPKPASTARPDFLCARDFEPIRPVFEPSAL